MKMHIKAFAHQKSSPLFCTFFFKVLPFTDDNGKTSKKSMKNRRDGFWCVKAPRRFCMLLFDVLPFTDDACVSNGKRAKSMRQFFLCQGL